MRVRWIKYRTAAALLRAWSACLVRQDGWSTSEAQAQEAMRHAVICHGMWAFVSTVTKVPVVRYWHAQGVSRERLAMMLGHELGHVTGKRARGHAAEEDRADEYGRVAMAVYRRMSVEQTGNRRR